MTTPTKPVHGLYAAALVPRDSRMALDERGLAATLEFLASRGIRRVVLNGATGEYTLTAPGDLALMMRTASAVLGPECELLCAAGSPSLAHSVELAETAFNTGARAILLPMPYFFPYSQDDLAAFSRAVAERAAGPVLLYNLPRFTSGLAVETVLDLVNGNIVGIKDSSGSFDILRALTEAGATACRIVGDDSILARAIEEGICDGAISGVASALPELVAGVWSRHPAAAPAMAELVTWLGRFPIPWGLKYISEWRGVAAARFPLPVAPSRAEQAVAFEKWFKTWWPEVESRLASPAE